MESNIMGDAPFNKENMNFLYKYAISIFISIPHILNLNYYLLSNSLLLKILLYGVYGWFELFPCLIGPLIVLIDSATTTAKRTNFNTFVLVLFIIIANKNTR